LKLQRLHVRQATSDADIEALIKLLEKGGFRRLTASNAQGGSALQPPSLRADVVIALTKPKVKVAQDLRDLIKRGKILLKEIKTSTVSSQQQLDQRSRFWHTWRVFSEQTMRQSFSSSEPLQRLKDLAPSHLNFKKSWQERAQDLPQDIEKELAYLENLLVRLDNYKELGERKEFE
jgi:hypothetical protein